MVPVPFIVCYQCGKNFNGCSCRFPPATEELNWRSELNKIQRRVTGEVKMKFIYGADTYCIEFHYNQVLCTYWVHGEKREKLSGKPAITATILKLDPTQAGLKNAEILVSETARHHYLDRYLPETGRRQALRFVCSWENARNGKVPKDMRCLIWQAYLNRGNPAAPVPSNPTPAPAPIVGAMEAEIFGDDEMRDANMQVLAGNFNVVH